MSDTPELPAVERKALPALPPAAMICGNGTLYTAGQMREYAFSALTIAHRERDEARAERDALRVDAERQNKLMHLASQDEVFFGGFLYNPDDTTFRVPPALVLCNDFFAPAADCQEFKAPEDIDALHDAYVKYGHAGVLAWVSLQREGAEPWCLRDPERLAEFHKVRSAIDAARATEPKEKP